MTERNDTERAAAVGLAILGALKAAGAGTETTTKRIVRDASGRLLKIVSEPAGAPEPVPSAVPITRTDLASCPRVDMPLLRELFQEVLDAALAVGLRLPPRLVVDWALGGDSRDRDGHAMMTDPNKIEILLNARAGGRDRLYYLAAHELGHASDYFVYGRNGFADDELERRAHQFALGLLKRRVQAAAVKRLLPERPAPALAEPEPVGSSRPIGARRL